MFSKTKQVLAGLKFVFFDFDGVFTDNRVIISEDGRESVVCNRSDGFGLALLRELGLSMAVISAETNSVVKQRCKKLNIDCYSGCQDKLFEIRKILKKSGILPEQAAFVGNDVNDLSCLQAVGLPVAVADAYPAIKKYCKIILRKKGGDQAVREICELIYKVKKNRK